MTESRIVVERPRVNARGKRADYFVAYSGDPESSDTVILWRGVAGETAAQVRAHAVDALAQAIEQQTLEVRAAAPGLDGAAQDVWILSGNPLTGYSYGRVRTAYGEPDTRASLHATTHMHGSALHAFESMLTHMADLYPAEQWTQFLWGSTAQRVSRIFDSRSHVVRYRFFREHAGYVVGKAAECALSLARAEQWAVDHGYTFRWEPDDMHDLDQEDLRHITDVECCTMLDEHGRAVASLGSVTFCIKDPQSFREARAYARVVEAELALDIQYSHEQERSRSLESFNFMAL